MGFWKCACLIAVLICAALVPALLIPMVRADSGSATVSILLLPNVGGGWVDNCTQVKEGAIDACRLKGAFIENNVPIAHPKEDSIDYPPYYSAAVYEVITTWQSYKYLITNGSGTILVNTHGEILTVPSGYTKEQWIDQISEAMLSRRITWVHTAGYPFFYVKYQNGTSEEWGENGFKHFMNHINKGNVTCWPGPGEPDGRLVTQVPHNSSGGGNSFPIFNWYYNEGPTIEIAHANKANLGRPLRWSDFKDYLIQPLYQYNYSSGSQPTMDVYMTGAVIAYVKAGGRYLSNYGCGAYVHIGTNQFIDGGGDSIAESDFLKGFIGTAAALWVETNRFRQSQASFGEHNWFGDYNSSIWVSPTVIDCGRDTQGNEVHVTLGFGVQGIYRFPEDNSVAQFEQVNFGLWTDDPNWSDVRFSVNLNSPALSKQAVGFGTETLTGTNTQRAEEFRSSTAHTILSIGSALPSPFNYIPSLIDGVMLAGEWYNFFMGGEGIDTYVDQVGVWYEPASVCTGTSNGYAFHEMSSIAVVDMKITNLANRQGWMVIPLKYFVNATLIAHDPLIQPEVGPILGTIPLAVYIKDGRQEDAGLHGDVGNPNIPGDAGNDYSSATQVAFPKYWHGYLDGWTEDPADCYSFTLNSAQRIMVEMTPPPYVNFDLQLKSPSGSTWTSQAGPGMTEHIEVDAGPGIWKVKVYKVSGSGVYSIFTSSVEGGGCPYVYTWNGTGFVKDNNILPASEVGNGTDGRDYYRLEQPLVPVYTTPFNSLYALQIREFENEIDYIDQAKLLAVDHTQDTNIAVTPEGEILTYTTPANPVSCIDNHDVDRLGEIATMNGNVSDSRTYFQGYQGDWLVLNFGHVAGPCAKLILRDDQKCDDICINVQIPDVSGNWQTVETLHPRNYWALEAVNMTAHIPANGDFLIRLFWTGTHRLDYVGLDTSSPTQVQMTSRSPELAVHSTLGLVTEKLRHDDENCVEIINNQQVTLAFTMPNQAQGTTRDFIFYTNGYYYMITS